MEYAGFTNPVAGIPAGVEAIDGREKNN